MKASDRRKLQSRIDRCTKLSNLAWRAQNELNNWCEEYYGRVPGDIDADRIIDGIFAANGPGPGMTADEFDAIMRDADEE